MSKYNDLELPALMDMLIKYTEDYTRMVTYRVFSVEEFSQCKQTLSEIHKAIKAKTMGKGKQDANNLQKFTDPSHGSHDGPSAGPNSPL